MPSSPLRSSGSPPAFRYLHVDASPDSRPILHRLGFAELAETTPYRYPGACHLPRADSPQNSTRIRASYFSPVRTL
jgi:hypothetical protein